MGPVVEQVACLCKCQPAGAVFSFGLFLCFSNCIVYQYLICIEIISNFAPKNEDFLQQVLTSGEWRALLASGELQQVASSIESNYFVVLCCVVLCCVVLCCVVLCCVVLRYVTLRYVVFVVLNCVMLSWVVL